jgi:hypothetical protein
LFNGILKESKIDDLNPSKLLNIKAERLKGSTSSINDQKVKINFKNLYNDMLASNIRSKPAK